MATAGVTGVTQATARRIPTLVSWSGGKDCCMALYALQRADLHEVRALLSTVSEIDHRIGMHGVHRDLIERQAAALALPLDQVPIPTGASNATYEAAVATGLARHRAAGVEAIAFGDLFLADIRAYREETIERSGMTPLFPVWGGTRRRLSRNSSHSASARSSPRSISGSWTRPSRAVRSIGSFWRASPPTWTHAARTASFTPSFSMAQTLSQRSMLSSAKATYGTGSAMPR